MNLRPYQLECLDAIDTALAERDDNPLVEIPTGGGKTVIFATKIREYLTRWPDTRVCILAHIKELLGQARDKLLAVWPEVPVGVYSAGLGSRHTMMPVTIAGIQSVHKRAFDFQPFDLVFVDEAHRIPLKDEGMYRRFLADAKLASPHLRVIGWTATPFRLDGGPIVGPDYILNHVCYRVSVKRLVEEGFLSPVTMKHGGAASVDTSGLHIRRGEFVEKEVALLVDTDAKVEQAVTETLRLAEGRQSFIFFCVGVAHAERTAAELAKRGIEAPVIHANTPPPDRARNIARFDAGEVRALCNVNVLAEGFDSTRIDCIVMLRPTASPGLYVQQVGRGLRLHPGKNNCLVLDFAENVKRHGPLDRLELPDPQKGKPGEAPMKVCPECQTYCYAGVRECKECGHEFPPPELKHKTKADELEILTPEGPQTYDVDSVIAGLHRKAGKPDSLRVTYRCGINSFTEWVCLEHEGYAAEKARQWWRRRFKTEAPATAAAALQGNLYLSQELAEMSRSITVRLDGKFAEIVRVDLKQEASERVYA